MEKTNKNIETKVICGNCGAELEIPKHEHMIPNAIAIGKDSNIGTVVLPAKGKKDAVSEMLKTVKNKPELMELILKVANHIEDDGYLDVQNVVRRWIPSQCLRMVYSPSGFHKSLTSLGYDYEWKVLVNDLKCQAQLARHKDMDGVKDRNRWYNKSLASKMANSYVKQLSEHIAKLAVCKHKNRDYVKLRCWLNNGRGVHTDELAIFWQTLNDAYEKIKRATTPVRLAEAVENFDKLRRKICWKPAQMDNFFINVYKAAGAYYTIKDLILFEGCVMKLDKNGDTFYKKTFEKDPRRFVGKKASLESLEDTITAVGIIGVKKYGYQMLGMLKDFLDYNKFNFDKTTEEWFKKSEARKSARKIAQNRRAR